MTTPLAIKTSVLEKRYFGNRVVRDVSLAVPRGQIYGLVGPNGAGKSTLMKLLCGFTLPTSGSFQILGRPMRPGEAHPRVGSLIERPGFHANLTARQNAMCRALALGLTDPQPEVACVLELVGLDPASRERVTSFSLGQKQRLGLALALLGTPDLLFLDEPFNGIDIASTARLRRVIQDLNERLGVTVFVSSHVIDQLSRFATHYGVMRKGSLIRELTASELEQACTLSTRVRTSAPERALAVLQTAFPQFNHLMLPTGELSLDPSVPTAHITKLLVEASIDVHELRSHGSTPEDFFASLLDPSTPPQAENPRTPNPSEVSRRA